MKKLAYVLLIVLISMVTLSSAAFAIVLTHSNYLSTISNWLGQQYLSPDITISNVSYSYPRELQFDIQDKESKQSHITVWLNQTFPDSIRNVSIDTILISNIDLSGAPVFYDYLKTLPIGQISFKNMDFHSHQLNLHNANLQIKNPHWDNHAELPYGEVQLQTKKVKIGQFTLHNVILDADHYEHNSMIYGLSFTFDNASIAIQAQKQDATSWSITSLTANHLDITPDLLHKLESLNKETDWPVKSIERLDILNSSFKNTLFNISNLSLSANNINANTWNLWSQDQLTLSASAEGLVYAGKQWVEPVLTAAVEHGQFNIKEFSAKLGDGYLNLSASLNPKALTIKRLRAENIKYYFETENDLTSGVSIPDTDVSIEKMQLRNSQIIQVAQQPYWQLSGINLDADNVQIVKQGQLRLWNGSVELSANNVSYGAIKGTQTILQMHSKNDTWYLDRFFSPLEQGYLELHGAWNYALDNGHWHLDLDADSFPLHNALQYFNLPVSISGLADISLQSEGLTGNAKIVSQTLSGNADVSIRGGMLKIPAKQDTITQPFTLDNLKISSHRGLITIDQTPLNSASMTSNLTGNVDLDNWDKGDIQLMVKQPSCPVIQLNLLHPATTVVDCHQQD